MTHFDPKAEEVAASAFLNALLREWAGWREFSDEEWTQVGGPGEGGIVLRLPTLGCEILAGAAHTSRSGIRAFQTPLLYREDPTQAPRAIAFLDLVALVTREPEVVGAAEAQSIARFRARVEDSTRNLARALARRGQWGRHWQSAAADFITTEQALVLGHPAHPTPRSRDEWGPKEGVAYAPELKAEFPLHWLRARKEILCGSDTRGKTPFRIAQELPGTPNHPFQAGPWGWLPVHPWQAAQLRENKAVAALCRAGQLELHESAPALWRPTSSLRTVFHPGSPWMLKFSLSVRLTNSLRHLHANELARGPLMARLMNGEPGRTLRQRYPSLQILTEPAWLALQDPAGGPLEESAVAFRSNPFGETGSMALMGTLCQAPPRGEPGPLAHLIRGQANRGRRSPEELATHWFQRFLWRGVEPLLIAQADYGLLFSAHQQNTLVRLKAGQPVGLVFRDCQGTGFCRWAIPQLARQAPEVAEQTTIFAGEEGNRLFGYYLVVNNLLQLIAALDREGLVAEEALYQALITFLGRVHRKRPRDPSFLEYLLESPVLYGKGNFRICFGNIDETTASDSPLAHYVTFPNPILEVRRNARGSRSPA